MHKVMAKGILSATNGMNLYRGCTHGCIYCDSRSACYQMTHDFEDIEIKINAPELLEQALMRKRNKCMITTGFMSDSYNPLEEKLEITRKCLSLIDKYEFGVAIQTKSSRILRDLDLLCSINKKTKCVVAITLTTFDDDLCKILEPNVSTTKERIEVLKVLRDHHIPTVVWLSPILPFINDTKENLSALLDACIEAKVYGIICFNMGLTLREGNREYFYQKLDEYFPGMKERYIKTFGNAYQVNSPHNEALMKQFRDTCKANHILYHPDDIFAYLHEYHCNSYEQISFDFF
ncbi:MAG: radical SAM protein [Lachnospiraceae bacterium]|nr:radical SAM protein [Lachnospiraceae bacterium]